MIAVCFRCGGVVFIAFDAIGIGSGGNDCIHKGVHALGCQYVVNILSAAVMDIRVSIGCRHIEHLIRQVRADVVNSGELSAKGIKVTLDNADRIYITIGKFVGVEISHHHQPNIRFCVLEGLNILGYVVCLLPAFFFDSPRIGAVYSEE